MKNKKKIINILIVLLIAIALIGVALRGFCVYCNEVIASCDDKCKDSPDELPFCEYALVPGTSKTVYGGDENFYYTARVESVAKLYAAGKVRYIIVSGDNSRKTYDETSDMKNDLISLGVPESAILCDFAGFRTLDSIYRAKNLFHCSELVIVTQRYHCARAIYLAEKIGINAMGLAAPEPDPIRFDWLIKRNHSREYLARIKAWLDVNIINSQPKFPQ